MASDGFSGGQNGRLLALCEALGYGPELRSEAYAVVIETGVVQVDLACFGRPEPKDISTATLVAGSVADDHSRALLRNCARALAAPVVLLEDLEHVELWRIAPQADDDELLVPDFTEERLAERGRLLDALAPESLVAHKHGFTSQLSLFDRDVALLTRARAQAEQALGTRIETAMTDLWPHPEAEPTTAEAEDIARTVVQALALLVARDKLTADRSFGTALAVLQERYGDAVAGLQRPDRLRRVQRAAALIGRDVRFDSMDSTILGDVYEGTFLKDVTRQRLGAYYTPPAVARKMLENLPVEELAPGERTALDLTCGSGTLLLAAWDRFVDAAVPGVADKLKSPGHLTGFDQDAFAVELARLALIIHDAAGRPSWRIERRDALRPRNGAFDQHAVVVGNPPWGYERPEGLRRERATGFLDAMIEACQPGGFVACLLPASWLSSSVAAASRASVRRSTDVVEIWRLPETTFALSGVAPCVLFARKRATEGRHWLLRRVHRETFKEFVRDVAAAPGQLVDDRESPDDAPFQTLRSQRLAGLRRLADVAEVRRGVPLPAGKRTHNPAGNVDFLLGFGAQKPFSRVNADALIRLHYPDDVSRRGESAAFWTRAKVLVATTTNVDAPQRVRAFLDERGVVPRNSMTAVVPKPNAASRRLALLAILNSTVVAEWLAGTTMRWIPSETLEAIPVPDEQHWEELAGHAAGLVELGSNAEGLTARQDALDAAVRRAYGLEPERSEPPLPAAARGVDAGIVLDDEETEPLLTIGTVLDVDGSRVLLHIAGFTAPEGEWRAPPPGLPGWACAVGVGFQVLGAEQGLDDAVYFPQEVAWRRDADIAVVETPA